MILELKTDLAVREKADGTLISTPESAAPFLEDMRHLAQEAFVVLTLTASTGPSVAPIAEIFLDEFFRKHAFVQS